MIKKYYKRFKHWMDYNPPGALTSKGWRLFKNEFKERAPIRYWFSHTLRYAVILPIKWKADAISDWIRYRTYNKYHVVDTGLKPAYYDKDTLMLHVNFNLLKIYVENELAWRDWCFGADKEPLTFVQKWIPLGRRIFPYHNPARGLKHLKWEATLDDPKLPPQEQSPRQAVAAREKIALYEWWVIDRPGRQLIDCGTYNEQGHDMGPLDDDFDQTAEDYKAYCEKMDQRSQQEEDWRIEDEEMLIRLVKIRETLWT